MKASDARKNQLKSREFSFSRSRGIVWVCDLESSSKYLNDNACAAELEKFLPRLYLISASIVEAAGGKFIKWTGDGFLAWFDVPLHRELSDKATIVFNLISHLSSFVNVTQLGAQVEKRFVLRHGVTYEKDAVLAEIKTEGESPALDLIGRDVVLAFRLSGIKAKYPGIATQKELADSLERTAKTALYFRRWQAKNEEILKFFKGERRGTSAIYVSADKVHKASSLSSLIKNSKKTIARAENRAEGNEKARSTAEDFVAALWDGPPWCKQLLMEYVRFLQDELLAPLKKMIEITESEIHSKEQ